MARRLSLIATVILGLLLAAAPAATARASGSTPDTRTAGGGPAAVDVYECEWLDDGSLCAEVLTNLNLRNRPHAGSTIILTMQPGRDFRIICWVRGDPVNGDPIWYRGSAWQGPGNVSPTQLPTGYAAGYYLSTGRDPNPSFPRC